MSELYKHYTHLDNYSKNSFKLLNFLIFSHLNIKKINYLYCGSVNKKGVKGGNIKEKVLGVSSCNYQILRLVIKILLIKINLKKNFCSC